MNHPDLLVGKAVHPCREDDWSEGVSKTAEYFRERITQMRYPELRADGYPIGSETVESGCKGY